MDIYLLVGESKNLPDIKDSERVVLVVGGVDHEAANLLLRQLLLKT